jgi:hypothetical protein
VQIGEKALTRIFRRLVERPDSIGGTFRERSDLFVGNELENSAETYVRLLATVAEHPECSLSQLATFERENRHTAKPRKGVDQPALGVCARNALA